MAILVFLALLAVLPGRVAGGPLAYRQVNLVADTPGIAANTDPRLVNPWGLAFNPAGGPFWVADNETGLSTLYNRTGQALSLVVTIPPAPGNSTGSPIGLVFNSSSAFNNDRFIFAGGDGIISGWRGGPNAVREVDHSANAGYTGATLATFGRSQLLYLADFRQGTIDVFNSAFQQVQLEFPFTDPQLPPGYAPFNIEALNGFLYVNYALRDEEGDEVAGPGNGLVDLFLPNGRFIRRLATGTGAGGTVAALNAPWGLTLAPPGFGRFSNALLVGNFGSGQIAALNPHNGAFLGLLEDTSGSPITIDGLWALKAGPPPSDRQNVYFTAGVEDETHGLFGRLEAARGNGG